MKQKTIKSQGECEITWNALSRHDWDLYFSKIKRSNLLQSGDYGLAMAKLNNQKLRRGVIKINGKIVGLLQILEAGIMRNAVHGVIIDRAPLWFDGHGDAHEFELFLQALSKEFPKRFGRRIRFIPEMDNRAEFKDILHKYGYKTDSNRSYQTIWLNLRPDLDVLRKKLNSKWRNKLVKAERQGLEIIFSNKAEHFSWLIQHYAADKAFRGYDGAKPKTIIALANEFSRGQNMMIGTALFDCEPIAAILLFNHGSSSTYQIGYTSDIGRTKCAHNLLLWRALEELKACNIKDFDLGGVNDESAKNVKIFKEGLGGKIHETLGLYR